MGGDLMMHHYRIAGLCPADQLEAMQAISRALGYGSGTFSVACSPTGAAPATHYAASTVATDRFLAELTDPEAQDARITGVDWTEHGFKTEEEAREVLRAMNGHEPRLFAVGPYDTQPRAQMMALLEAHGLQQIAEGPA